MDCVIRRSPLLSVSSLVIYVTCFINSNFANRWALSVVASGHIACRPFWPCFLLGVADAYCATRVFRSYSVSVCECGLDGGMCVCSTETKRKFS